MPKELTHILFADALLDRLDQDWPQRISHSLLRTPPAHSAFRFDRDRHSIL